MSDQRSDTFSPTVPASANMAEVSFQSVILGILLGVILTAANAYLGLKVGLTVSASIPAAVISMGILRGLLRRGTILENNIVQTIAASGESLAAGVIFTIPALIIAGVWTEIRFWPTMLVCFTGGLLGICFMIPLRRTLIVEDRTLTYPEGVACAEVLKAGDKGGSSARTIGFAMIVGALVKILSSGVTLIKGTLEWVIGIGHTAFFVGAEVAPALVGVGYIVGLNIAAAACSGGLLVCGIAVPWLGLSVGIHGDVQEWFWAAWRQMRFLGVGTMAVGGVWSVIKVRSGIMKGLREASGGYRHGGRAAAPLRTEVNMDRRHLVGLLVLAVALVFLLYSGLLHLRTGIALAATVSMFLMSFLFVAVASYIVGLIGSSNSPVSGMTICAVLFTGAFLGVLGMSGAPAIVATLGVAGVVCCAACSAGDISQDLKTGYIIGATPRRQQWMEVIGAVIPALAMAPILIVLHRAYGIGTGQPGALNAPQATLFANLVKGLFGAGALPWKIILVGAALGVGIIIADGILRARRAPFHLPVMAVAVGMYLPLPMTMAMLFGGLVSRFAKNRSESGPGVLFASGLVAGEAVMGVVIGILIYIHKEITPLVELPIRLIRVPLAGSDALSVLFLLGVGALLYAVGRRERKPASVDPA